MAQWKANKVPNKCLDKTDGNKHDVFLSFGGDKRRNFTAHLYEALVSGGVRTFIEDNELRRGKEISSKLLKAMEESKLSVVVFSKSYAYFRGCLDVLVKIIECQNTKGQTVIPIFYDVDLSNVHKQFESYAEAFAKHEECSKDEMEMVKKWKEALTEVGNLPGWDLQSMANGNESIFIQMIVKDIIRVLTSNIRNGLHVATHPVALESRVEVVTRLLGIGSGAVRIVGIYGMSGIGKTTIAKAVYNKVCEGFEGCCFLSNIKDDMQQPNGLARKQEQLLSDILSWKHIKIDNIDRGVNLIKRGLCCRRVFLVLDDLVESMQWRRLVGDRKSFGPGSRILVTTSDERLLTELEVDKRYKVEELNLEDSMELLSWHAFRWPVPEKGYLELSNRLVEYAQGLPLALEILGSFLFKRSQLEWQSFVEKLRKIPHHQIQKELRIMTYDTLGDDSLKAMFLDIACFFVGMDKGYVIKILDGCGFSARFNIDVLLGRSLIAIDPDTQKLQMHDLLRDMGREIVRELSSSHPGHRSRLWFHKDVLDVLTKHKGTEAVEGLSLDVPALQDVVTSTEAFAKMINLRLLKIDSMHFIGSYQNFSKELRWLHWHRCPLKVLPHNLHLDNLVVLDMRFSSIRELLTETKCLHKLKILDLSYSVYLEETPNFARLSSIERLELEGCTRLVLVDQSIGNLVRLEFLNLANCKNIRELPDSICNLRSLETINLHGCSKLCSLPEHLGKLEALRKLVVSESAITKLPTLIEVMKNLEDLSPARLGVLPSKPWFSFFSPSTFWLLSKSWFSFFSSRISPKGSAGSSSLLLPKTFPHSGSLSFGENKFYDLPAGISNPARLQDLVLNDCENLRSISELPKNLMTLKAKICTSLERFPNLSNIGDHILCICISNCHEIVDMQGWDFRLSQGRLPSSWIIEDLYQPQKLFSCKLKYLEAYFLAREVPDWFDYKEVGSSVLFCVPSIWAGKSQAMIVCAIYSFNDNESISPASITVSFKNRTKSRVTLHRPLFSFDGNLCQDHAWVSYMTPFIFSKDTIAEEEEHINAEEGDEIEVSIEPRGGILVKKCGIHLPIHEN